MGKIFIKKINIGDKQICFKEGMNIIVGDNGSGKTVLFNIIRYIFGIKRRINVPGLRLENSYIDIVDSSDRHFRIKRELNSNTIEIEGTINEAVRIGSDLYYELYNSILSPSFNFGDDITSAIEILENSFMSEIDINKSSIDISKKILGINVGYLKKSRQQIEGFENKINKDEEWQDMLKIYMSSVAKKINDIKEIKYEEINNINNILNEEYMILCQESVENKLLIKESQDAYNKIKISSDQVFVKRYSKLDSYFQKICRDVGLRNDYRLIDVLENKTRLKYLISGSELKLIYKLAKLVLSMNIDDITINSLGLLVVDEFFGYDLDFRIREELMHIVEKECEYNKLQYIEFTCERRVFPKRCIIHDLSEGGAFSWA